MKRKLFASAMTGILAVSALTGCASGEVTPNEGNKTPVAIEIPDMTEPTSIEMWHFMSGKQQEVLQSIIDEFNATNNMNITVSAVAQGKIPDLNKKVIAAEQSNTLPAIINVYPDLATGLIEKGAIYDISSFASHPEVGMEAELKSDFVEAFIAEVSQWDGKLYGMPMTKSTEVIYVNKTLLEKIGYTEADVQGMTMDKLAEISKAAKEQLGIPGFGYDSGSNGFISTLKMDGKNFVDLDGTINVDNEWVRTFMDFYKEQVTNGYFRTPGEDGFLSGPFSNQQMLMYQGSTAGASFIDTNGQFELIAVEPAYFEGKDKAVIQQGGSLFVTTDVTPQEQFAAYEFIKFATNTENTAKFATETGYLPVRKSAAETDIVKNILADPEAVYAKVYPVAQTARSTIQEKFEAYVNGNITDIEAFIQESLAEVGTSIQRQ